MRRRCKARRSAARTHVSVDAKHHNVYVSDYGQQAVYSFPTARRRRRPDDCREESQNAASILSTPDGNNVLISGGLRVRERCALHGASRAEIYARRVLRNRHDRAARRRRGRSRVCDDAGRRRAGPRLGFVADWRRDVPSAGPPRIDQRRRIERRRFDRIRGGRAQTGCLRLRPSRQRMALWNLAQTAGDV